jgi:hypothetical protein
MVIKRILPPLLALLCLGLTQVSLALTKEAAINKVTKDPKSLQTL